MTLKMKTPRRRSNVEQGGPMKALRIKQPVYYNTLSSKETTPPGNFQALEKNTKEVLTVCNGFAYHVHVAAKSATNGIRSPEDKGALAQVDQRTTRFACPLDTMAVTCGKPSGLPDSFPGTANPHVHRLHRFAALLAVPEIRKEPTTMKNPLVSLQQSRASAHRAMAHAALRSNSSLSVRRNRYNQHMTKARAALACAQQYAATPEAITQESRHA